MTRGHWGRLGELLYALGWTWGRDGGGLGCGEAQEGTAEVAGRRRWTWAGRHGGHMRHRAEKGLKTEGGSDVSNFPV